MAQIVNDRALRRADAIARQIGNLNEVEMELDGFDDDRVIEALEKRGCVVQRYLDSQRATVYLLTNKRPEIPLSAHVML